ncbi:unnamed protein product [Cladocopium goreaui]|uniref:Uncharacterized protein n=1 Tax=Cladocopium goreaui TaxID=2562237 RepID=A0A9P1FT37_9DINO|nr:unnamed protein product [Cladocopium goreaui]
MRKRWRDKYSAREARLDDSPTDMPVSLPGDELDAHEFDEDFNNPLLALGGSFEPLDASAGLELHEPSEQVEASFPPSAPVMPFRTAASDSRVKFVDKSLPSASSEPARFETVASMASPAVVSEALRLTDKRPVLYPWEKGRLKQGVNNFVQVGVAVSDGFQLDASVSVQYERKDAALFQSVVKNIIGCTYMEEREAQREHAIRQWWDLLRLNLNASDPGRAAVQETGLSNVFRYGIELLDAIFGLKSPNTLLKRLCILKMFNLWMIRNYSETWLPLVEQRVWDYVRHLRNSKAPASRAVSLLGSIRFCFYTMKVDGSQEVLESLRIKGLAAQIYARKKPWRPSDVLSVNEVEFLHLCFMDESRCDVDRIFIGHLLHMLYARARFSDLLAVMELFIDEEDAFLEVSATLHKGARSMDARSKLLPIVAPAVGIKGGNWAKAYLALRLKAGLRSPGSEAVPMLLSPKRSGIGWDDRYITSSELNKFIKRLFSDGGRMIAGRKITTHSMKATGLSWCSKLGVAQEHRAILARHATSVQGATVLYSQDLLSSALRSFTSVLEAIRKQTFQPDKSRSGMITPAAHTPAGAPATPFPKGLLVPDGNFLGSSQSAAFVATEQSEAALHGMHQGAMASEAALGERKEGYSPGTPIASPEVKLEFTWPETAWDNGVIDLEDQHDLLSEWNDGSEEESSSCSDSDSDGSLDWAEPEDSAGCRQPAPALVPKWYINVKTNVIHEVKDDKVFRCGRQLGQIYVAVPALTGLRCGKCFAHCL